MKKFILLLTLIVLAGCADTRTKEEIDWDHQIDRDNWRMCVIAMKQTGDAVWHIDHIHNRRDPLGMNDHRTVHWDLRDNKCRLRLGGYWVKK